MRIMILTIAFTFLFVSCEANVTKVDANETTDPNIGIVPPIDFEKVIGLLEENDYIVILDFHSLRPAKSTIYKCTVIRTFLKKLMEKEMTMSFLHFPNCRRFEVGKKHLCIIRTNGDDISQNIRSDMLSKSDDIELYSYI